MTKQRYVTETLALIVKPEGEPIFSELATRIELEDEAAGCFVAIRQPHLADGKVLIDGDEWPALRAAVDQMLSVASRINAAVEDKGKAT